jgi:hypothetical protein
MKKTLNACLLTAALVLAIISAPQESKSRAVPFKSCSCSAPDGSCSVTISCQGGCDKFCGNGDNCWATCSGFFSDLALETNIEIVNGNSSQLTTKLGEISGRDISFSPARKDDPKSDVIDNLGFQKSPLWNALEFLSDRGTVRFGGKDFESLRRLRKTLLAGKRLNFGVNDTPVNTFVNDLAGLTGLRLRIVSGSQMALVNVELPNATLDEIIKEVSKQTGTVIVESEE